MPIYYPILGGKSRLAYSCFLRYNNNLFISMGVVVKKELTEFAGAVLVALGLLILGYGLIFHATPFFWGHDSSAAFSAATAAAVFGVLSGVGAACAIEDGWGRLRRHRPAQPAPKA